MRLLLALALATAGCLGTKYHQCPGQDWLCPDNLACTQAPAHCGNPVDVKACMGLSDFDSCGSGGACSSGVCTECSADLEGCPQQGWVPMQSPVAGALRAIWAAGFADVYAAGDEGIVIHYNGVSWAQIKTLPGPMPMEVPQVTSISGNSTSDLYALTNYGQVFHYDGTMWTDIAQQPAVTFSALWAVSPTRLVAVGTLNRVMVYDGSSWMDTSLTVVPSVTLNAVWGSGDELFAVGKYGAILHYSPATGWETSANAPVDSMENLYAVWGTNTSDVIAAGQTGTTQPAIVHFNGTSWAEASFPTSALFLRGAWLSATNAFTCGQTGAILQAQDPSATWSLAPKTPPGAPDLSALTGTSATDVFAVGAGGAIWHYTGGG